jgi:hypothetical protein
LYQYVYMLQFFVNYAVLMILLIFILTILISLRKKQLSLPRLSFSVQRYYLLLLPAPLAAIMFSLQTHSYEPIILFALFSIAGVVGETLFSFWWQTYYTRRFWTYTTNTLFKKYTSKLNFLAWGVGGYIYLCIVSPFIDLHQHIPFYFMVVAGIFLLLQLCLFYLFFKNKIFKKVTFSNWLYFHFPIILALASSVFVFGVRVLVVFILFALFAWIAEYAFGKFCEFFLQRKLWTYNYCSYDHKHLTFLSLFPFGFGGMYFWLIASLVL